ncbi:MAG TPA: ATP-binding protein [Candidatus Nitrosocosmicus sp.]
MQNNVDINVLISQVIEDIKKKYLYTDKLKKISILFLPFGNENISEIIDLQNKSFDQLVNPLKCDYQKISQVVFNLLDNAMKFTIENDVVISVLQDGIKQGDNIEEVVKNVNCGNKNQNYIIVTVKNVGLGVDPEIKDHLFEKFFTKSVHRTGLGLYLSKIIVEAHGGRIWFEEHGDDDIENLQYDIDHIDKNKITTIFRFSLPI